MLPPRPSPPPLTVCTTECTDDDDCPLDDQICCPVKGVCEEASDDDITACGKGYPTCLVVVARRVSTLRPPTTYLQEVCRRGVVAANIPNVYRNEPAQRVRRVLP